MATNLQKLEFASFCIEEYKKTLSMVYTSPVYANLEQENTKYWWQGPSSLYYDLVTTPIH